MNIASSRLASFFLPAFAALLALLASPLPASDRVALVIGVDAYDNLPASAQLSVAVSDARLMERTLAALDPPFAVEVVTDAGVREVEAAFERFVERARGAECALVYFAGHGVEYHGENFLLTRDTSVSDVSEDVALMKRRLGREAVSMQAWVDSLDATDAAVKVVVLDCCRDNPLEAADRSGRRSVVGSSRGLAQVSVPSGTLISYSADAGQQANDGLFTEVLARQIAVPGRSILHVFAATREEVAATSAAWAAEDRERGLPEGQRRARHEPAEYNKLNLAGIEFAFARGVPREVAVSEGAGGAAAMAASAELERLRAQLAEAEAARAAASEGNAAEMARMQRELEEARAAMAAAAGAEPSGSSLPFVPSLPSDPPAPSPGTMARTDPAPAGAFPAASAMEGARAGEVKTFGGIEMVWCPPGEFLMGSPEDEEGRDDDERPHRVSLTRGFWLAKTETTQGQWESVMGSNPSHFKGADLPVESVSWEDAQGWLAKMNERHRLPAGWAWELPTEAQWEYACRAGTTTPFHFGASLNGREANCNGNYPYGTSQKGPYLGETAKVGSYAANAWGLRDMHGNVWEWCRDWYGDYPTAAVTDPSGPETGDFRVFRGGSWSSYARYCRAAFRGWRAPGYRNRNIGFRPALVPSTRQ